MHAFVTKHYFESPWCLAELRLWRILGALQSWRTTSYTLIHGELTNMPAGLLIGPVVDSNNIFRRDDLRDLLPKGPSEDGRDYLAFDQTSREEWFTVIENVTSVGHQPVTHADIWQKLADLTFL